MLVLIASDVVFAVDPMKAKWDLQAATLHSLRRTRTRSRRSHFSPAARSALCADKCHISLKETARRVFVNFQYPAKEGSYD
jgi:hypothetical protein